MAAPQTEEEISQIKEALLTHYDNMRNELFAAIDGLSDELLSEPSLDGWSVKDHLAHLSMWDDIRAAEIVRISEGYEATWQHMGGEQNEAFNALVQGMRKELSAAQVKWELESSRRKVLDAISSASPRGLDGSLYREAGLMSTHEAMHTVWIKRWREEKGL